MLKVAVLLVSTTTLWLAFGDSSTKSYVLSNSKRLKAFVNKSKKTNAPLNLSEMFSEHVEDVNQLLDSLQTNESDTSKNETKQLEIIQQISKHMEILQKLLSFMTSASPSQEMQRYCATNQLFHDVICNRPVKKRVDLLRKESEEYMQKQHTIEQSRMNRTELTNDDLPGYP